MAVLVTVVAGRVGPSGRCYRLTISMPEGGPLYHRFDAVPQMPRIVFAKICMSLEGSRLNRDLRVMLFLMALPLES